MSAVLEVREPSARYLEATPPALFRQFDVLATAPGSARLLRELILSLAVQGRLVRQEASDEPADQLLMRLAADRKLGQPRQKKQLELAPQASEDSPRLPASWRAVPLASIATKLTDGSHNPPRDSGSGVPMLSSQNVWEDGSIDFASPTRYVSPEDFERENSRTQACPDDVLLTIVASLGRSAVVPPTAPMFVLQRSVAVIRTGMVSEYLAMFLRSPLARTYYDEHGKGTAQKGIYLGKLGELLVHVPPLAEQARIVARVDELMRLCDALEAKGRLEAEQHVRLLGTLLGTLTDSTTPEELATNWQRVAAHFDLLLDRPEAVDVLEQTAVQLAVRGLLTEQRSGDESASALVARINDGRTSRRASTSVAPLAEATREDLPPGWCVSNVGSVAECLDYMRRPVKKADREEKGGTVPYFGANGQVGWISEHLFDEELVLVVEDETFIGRTKPFSYVVRGKSWVNNHAHVLRPLGGMSAEYLDLCLHRYDFIPLTSGTTNRRKLTQPGLLNAEFLLAPLAEQARIVARVTELRCLCTTLRQRLAAQQAVQSHLADALVEQALA